MRIPFITLLTIIFFTNSAYACKCINPSALELYKQSDVVVLGTPSQNLKGDTQSVRINQTIKGDLTESNIILSQQKTSCRYAQLPLSNEHTYLLFISSQDGENKLLSRCSVNAVRKDGTFDLRLENEHANIHAKMLKSFFEANGEIPDIKFHISHSQTENGIKTFLGIINKSEKDIEIFDPSNRNAYTFFAIDNKGNILSPTGSAKVDPKGGVLKISGGSSYNHIVESQKVSFPYLSNTAQFGYQLEDNQRYRIHVLYRPYGGTYGSISSEEKTIGY